MFLHDSHDLSSLSPSGDGGRRQRARRTAGPAAGVGRPARPPTAARGGARRAGRSSDSRARHEVAYWPSLPRPVAQCC
ncbi:hypothetical protein MicB006_2724 [Micromonospora sp. B006]|nr:hypothetical protein MicB006_2724 [Micromonospora sp. B006]